MPDYSQLSLQQLLERLEQLQNHPAYTASSNEELQYLLHELQLYQVELEIQNRELIQTQQKLSASRQRYRTLYELAPVGYLQLDGSGRISEINGAGAALLNEPAEQLVNRPLGDWLVGSADRQRLQEHLQCALDDPAQPQRLELIINHHDGQPRYLMVLSQAIPDPQPARHCFTVLVDITDRIRIRTLQHDVQHDALTGLANRNLLMQRLELALQRAARHPDFCFALLFVDLDRFKAINDNLGHRVGDQVLIAVAEQLQTFVRRVDLAARLGGDEFVILLENMNGLHQPVQIAERITETFRQPLKLVSGQTLFISASIGIAAGSAHYGSAQELLHDADIAMYRAKTRPTHCIQIFDPDMRAEATERLRLEQELRQAVESDRGLMLYFQPIVELDSGELWGLEALLRWQHPRHGLLAPATFITVAEETGLIVALSDWVIQQACRQCRQWQQRFPRVQALRVSINLSPWQCQQDGLPDKLRTVLAETRLPGHCLNLELTEQHLMADPEGFLRLLAELDGLGVGLAIDDFGTGFSSLSYLHRFNLQQLKLDTGLVGGIHVHEHAGEIVLSILDLARRLRLVTVAEGIETTAQRDFLQESGCRLGQGRLFSAPLPASELAVYLAGNNPE